MNDIITLTTQSIGGQFQKTVNARELHDALEVGKDFSTWIKDRIEKYGFVEGVDYVRFSPESVKTPSGGRPTVEYYISLSMGKELAMVERTPKGREVRMYFIRCEKELQEVRAGNIAIPQTLPEALRLAADLAEKNQKLLEQERINAPKVEWCDRVVAANEHMTITQAAKTLGYPPRKFKDYLRQIGFIYAQADTPMQEHIKAGREVLRFAHYTSSDGTAVEKPYTHITSKGLKYLYERFVKDGLIKTEDLFQQAA